MQFGIGHPPPTHQLQCTCVGEGSRVPNLQTEFNYLNSFKSYGIFSDFVAPMVPTLSPLSPCHPHIVPIAPRRSPWLWSLWSPPLSPWSPPHVVPVGPHIIPTSSPCRPCHPHVIPIAPRRSPCGPHGCGLRGLLRCLHPMLSPSSPLSPLSPHRPHHPHIIYKVPTSSPTPQISTPPNPHPLGGGGPQISKNAIRFELIDIF